MKTIKSTLFMLALSLLLGTPALAQTTSPAHTLSAHDLELLFEQDGEPLQLALLSEQEMRETEGAWLGILGRAGWGAFTGILLSPGSTNKVYGFGFYDFVLAHVVLGMISATPALGAMVGVPLSVLVQQHGSVGNLVRYMNESAIGREF